MNGEMFQYGAVTPKYATIISAGATLTVVPAVTGKKIRVLSYTVVCTAAGTVQFKDGAGGTAITGAMPFDAKGGVSAPFNPGGHFETSAGTLLQLADSVGSNVFGHLMYIEV